MNIKRAKEELKNTVAMYLRKDEYGKYEIPAVQQRPVFLIGPSGIGKTAVMEQVARECDLALVAYTITHHTRQSAIGLPFVQEKVYGGKQFNVTEYTMSEIIASVYERMEATGKKEGILFLDEINCVSETLAPTMLQFLQTKTFGNVRLPQGWIVVTAGNPPEYNRSVREFDVATLDRIKYIPVEADYSVWKEYAYQKRVHGSILSYLENKQENFYRMETTVDGKRFVTARGWEDLSAVLCSYEKLGFPVDADVAAQYLQDRKVAVDFANFLELYRKYEKQYRVEDILLGKEQDTLRHSMENAAFDERISLTAMILSGLSGLFARWYDRELYVEELFGWLKEYKKRLPETNDGAGMIEGVGMTEDIGKIGDVGMTADTASAEDGKKMTPVWAEKMAELVAQAEKKLAREQAGGLLLREEENRRERVIETLRRYEYGLRAESGVDGQMADRQMADGSCGSQAGAGQCERRSGADGFERVRGWFAAEKEELFAQAEKVSSSLANAFHFMEECFCREEGLLAGPEMIYFVTELESSRAALAFIQENGSEDFYRYSSRIYGDENREKLLAELSELS